MDIPVIKSAVVTAKLTITIRAAVNADVRKLEWFGEYWEYRGLFEKTYRDHLNGSRIMLVADTHQFPVGRMFIGVTPGNLSYSDGRTRGYLYSLNVMSHFRRAGIGTALIQHGESLLRERGFSWVTIAVATDNPDARRLYERLGYREFDRIESSWRYRDPDGNPHFVRETCWGLQKRLE